MSLVIRAAICIVGALGLAGATSAEEWNQEDATAAAVELREATQALYDSFYKQPTQGIGSGQARAYLELKQQLRRVRLESRHLANSLEGGEGHDETLPIYRNLMEEVRSAQENARSVYSTSPVVEKANVARAALEKLAAFYALE